MVRNGRMHELEIGPDGALKALAGIDLFEVTPREHLDALARQIRLERYMRRQVIIEAGTGCDVLVGLATGSARLFRSSVDGHEVTLAVFETGETFGLSDGASTVMLSSTLEAASDEVTIVRIPRKEFDTLLAVHPPLALKAKHLMGMHLAQFCDRVEDLALHTVCGRVAHELARQAQGDDRSYVGATREELGSWIGASPFDISRSMRVLREQGLIASKPHQRGVDVLDIDALTSYDKEL